MSPYEFKTGVISPIECFKEGWELIKDRFWLFFGITFVGMLIGGVIPFGIGLGAMFCGIYYCLFLKMNNQEVKFEDVFKGFSYFLPGLVATLVIIIPAIIMAIVLYASMFAVMFAAMDSGGRINESAIYGLFATMAVEMILLWLVLGTIHVFLVFAYPLIVEFNMKGFDAFKLSAKAAWNNLGGVVGFITLEFLLGIAAYILTFFIFGLGIYFVLPIMFAGALVMYRKVFPQGNMQNLNNPPPPNAFSGAGNYN